MTFSLKNLGVNIWSRDRTYGPKCHNGRTAPSLDVRLECDKGTPFLPAVPQLLFSLFYSCFSRNMTNRRFSIDLDNSDQSDYSNMFFNPGEF
jgi:hypothetical protein